MHANEWKANQKFMTPHMIWCTSFSMAIVLTRNKSRETFQDDIHGIRSGVNRGLDCIFWKLKNEGLRFVIERKKLAL